MPPIYGSIKSYRSIRATQPSTESKRVFSFEFSSSSLGFPGVSYLKQTKLEYVHLTSLSNLSCLRFGAIGTFIRYAAQPLVRNLFVYYLHPRSQGLFPTPRPKRKRPWERGCITCGIASVSVSSKFMLRSGCDW